jgi:hypothetical protein
MFGVGPRTPRSRARGRGSRQGRADRRARRAHRRAGRAHRRAGGPHRSADAAGGGAHGAPGTQLGQLQPAAVERPERVNEHETPCAHVYASNILSESFAADAPRSVATGLVDPDFGERSAREGRVECPASAETGRAQRCDSNASRVEGESADSSQSARLPARSIPERPYVLRRRQLN